MNAFVRRLEKKGKKIEKKIKNDLDRGDNKEYVITRFRRKNIG